MNAHSGALSVFNCQLADRTIRLNEGFRSADQCWAASLLNRFDPEAIREGCSLDKLPSGQLRRTELFQADVGKSAIMLPRVPRAAHEPAPFVDWNEAPESR
jgi:hypothetical protein